MGFDNEDFIDTRIWLSGANKGALMVVGMTSLIALCLGKHNLWMSFLVVENVDELDHLILGREFIRKFDVTIDLNKDSESAKELHNKTGKLDNDIGEQSCTFLE